MKEIIVRNFLKEQNLVDIIPLHNAFCEKEGIDMKIYPLNKETIDEHFPSSYDLLKSLNFESFNLKDSFFTYHFEKILTDVELVINYHKLVDFLIENGDSGCKFDITPYLMKKFKDYAYDILCEKYSMDEISQIVDESSNDFLMEEWSDIISDLFDKFVKICPVCHSVIFKDYPHEYIYERGQTQYECDVCQTHVYV